MHLFNLKKSLVSLYICLVALLAVVTFVEHVRGTEFVEKYVYHTVWFCCLWGVLAALAVVVLVKRQLWRRLPTLLLHGSFLVILVGAMITFSYSKKGYMHLTVGTEVGTFIDQDSKRVIELHPMFRQFSGGVLSGDGCSGRLRQLYSGCGTCFHESYPLSSGVSLLPVFF